MNGGFGDFGRSHLGSKSARTDKIIKSFLEVVGTGSDFFDVGRADGLVGLLSPGGFSLEIANLKVFFAIFFFDIASDLAEGLLREIQRVGTVVSNVTGLVEPLGGAHSGRRGEAELGIGFNLQGGGCKGDGVGFGAVGLLNGGDGPFFAV